MATGIGYADVHIGDDLAHALSAGSSESTVESQHVRAIAILTATPPQNPVHATALTAAIALLNADLAHVRDPHGH